MPIITDPSFPTPKYDKCHINFYLYLGIDPILFIWVSHTPFGKVFRVTEVMKYFPLYKHKKCSMQIFSHQS